jgi:hypothetical protein
MPGPARYYTWDMEEQRNRQPNRRYYQPDRPQSRPAAPAAATPQQAAPAPSRPVKGRFAMVQIVAGSIALIAILAAAIFFGTQYQKNHYSPAARAVAAAKKSGNIDFPVYYPEEAKMASGYTFDLSSIKQPQEGILLYEVDYSTGKKIIITEQKRPSDSEIQNFYANFIPIRVKMSTKFGTAEVGAHSINSKGSPKTVVSLPMNDSTAGPWLLITAPYDVNQDQLRQVLNSLKT